MRTCEIHKWGSIIGSVKTTSRQPTERVVTQTSQESDYAASRYS